jgi:hypothetical protein
MHDSLGGHRRNHVPAFAGARRGGAARMPALAGRYPFTAS